MAEAHPLTFYIPYLYKYLLSTSSPGFRAEPPRIGHHTGSTLPPGIAGNNHIPGQIKLAYMHEVIPQIQDLRTLCTDVPPPSEKSGEKRSVNRRR